MPKAQVPSPKSQNLPLSSLKQFFQQNRLAAVIGLVLDDVAKDPSHRGREVGALFHELWVESLDIFQRSCPDSILQLEVVRQRLLRRSWPLDVVLLDLV